MMEIAISLAVIGIALVAIIGVLPIGMRAQRDNRERTLINQDATVFLQAIRDGAQGVDDLTNYVYAITNTWTFYNADGSVTRSGVNGYTYAHASISPGYFENPAAAVPIYNGINIIGLLTTPEFTDPNGFPTPSLIFGGYSNHIVACVHSISGLAVEKPPQNNDIMRADSFGYYILCANAPAPHYMPPVWQKQPYTAGDMVSQLFNGQITYWRANADTAAADVPGSDPPWVRLFYWQNLDQNLHQMRLTFLWPVLPNGRLAPFPARQTYRLMVGGQISQTNYNYNTGQRLYFFQPQVFSNTP